MHKYVVSLLPLYFTIDKPLRKHRNVTHGNRSNLVCLGTHALS